MGFNSGFKGLISSRWYCCFRKDIKNLYWTDVYCISTDETEFCKIGIVIRDFKPSASKSDFILSCEGFFFFLLNSFDTQFSVHSAEFDGVVALRLSAALAVYFVVSVMTVIASTSCRIPPSLTPHQHYFACYQSITARVNIVEATGGFWKMVA